MTSPPQKHALPCTEDVNTRPTKKRVGSISPVKAAFLEYIEELTEVDARPISTHNFLTAILHHTDVIREDLPDLFVDISQALITTLNRLHSDQIFLLELEPLLAERKYLQAIQKVLLKIREHPCVPPISSPRPTSPNPWCTSLGDLSDEMSTGLYHLYDLLWNKGASLSIETSLKIPSIEQYRLSPFFNFTDSDGPETNLIDGANNYAFTYLRIPDWSRAHFPFGEEMLRKVFVRPCYPTLLEELDTVSHAVLLGQPGTGKSGFINYALVERLRHKLPTIIQFDSNFIFSFSDYGTFRHPAQDYGLIDQPPAGTWYLVDRNDGLSGLPESAQRVGRWCESSKVVQVALPAADTIHKGWGKSLEVSQQWIGACSWEELYVIGCTDVATTPISPERLSHSRLKYGTSISTCRRTAQFAEASAQQDALAKHEILKLLPYPFQWMRYFGIPAQELPYVLFDFKPSPDLSTSRVEPTSMYAYRCIVDRVARTSEDIFIKFYRAHVELQPTWDDEVLMDIPGVHDFWIITTLARRGGMYVIQSLEGDKEGLLWLEQGRTSLALSTKERLYSRIRTKRYRNRLLASCVPQYQALMADSENNVWIFRMAMTPGEHVIEGEVLEELAHMIPEHLTWNVVFVVPSGSEAIFAGRWVVGLNAAVWQGKIHQFTMGVDLPTLMMRD